LADFMGAARYPPRGRSPQRRNLDLRFLGIQYE
jgi:hypothetical protein